MRSIANPRANHSKFYDFLIRNYGDFKVCTVKSVYCSHLTSHLENGNFIWSPLYSIRKNFVR